MADNASRLAIHGGPKAVQTDTGDIFTWPIITEEDEQAVLEVLRAGTMSNWDVTKLFEQDFAEWHGVEHCLGFNTGTAALHAAMWACDTSSMTLTPWRSALSMMASMSQG